MNLKTKLVRWLLGKAGGEFASQMFQPSATWMGVQYSQLASEGYMQNTDVYSASNRVAKGAAGVPLILYRQSADGKTKTEVGPAHPLQQLLNWPNPRQSRARFISTLILHRTIAGHAYILRNPPDKPPTELWLLRPDRVDVKPPIDPADYEPRFYYGTKGLEKEEQKPDRFGPTVLQIADFHPLDELHGLSRIQAGARAIDQGNAIQTYTTALVQNQARPSGALISEDNLSPEDVKDLKATMREKIQGPENAGMPMVMSGKMSWQQMSLSPKDVDWVEGSEQSTRRICATMGMAPEIIGDSRQRTYSNYQEARKSLYTEAILPELDDVIEALNQWLVPLFGKVGDSSDLVIGYDVDKIEALQEDQEKKWARVTHAVQSCVLTPNEAREELGFSTRPEGDVMLVPIRVTQLDPEGPPLTGTDLTHPPQPGDAPPPGAPAADKPKQPPKKLNGHAATI